MRRLLGVIAFGMATAGFAAPPAWAQDQPVIEIPLDTVVRGDPGSEHELATVASDPEDVGLECDVAAEGVNNESPHPDTDLLVRSGDAEVVVPDVEREPGAVTEAADTITLGPDVSVFVRLGPDGIFSGGLVLTLDCMSMETTTTTTSTTTTTVVETTTTTNSPTTTTVPSTTTSVPVVPAGETLPNTGSSSQGLVVAAAIMLLIGGTALVARAKLGQRHRA